MRVPHLPLLAATGLLPILCLVACGEKNTFVAPPPLEVEVISPQIGPVTVYLEMPGRTVSYARAEVRARVKGFLEEVKFSPGKTVKKGEVLFTIEPEQFQASLATAKGQEAKALADLEIATTNYEKRKQASASGAVSAIDVAAAEAEMKAADALVKIAQAEVADADRDFGYTRIISPIDGRVSKSEVDVGNLVGADGATLLTTVVQDHPIFVEFEVNERDILKHLPMRRLKDEGEGAKEREAIPVRLTLSDGNTYPVEGQLDFLDNAVDPNTGTIRARAVFDNPEEALTSGLFVRVGIPLPRFAAADAKAIRVPAEVVQRDLGGSYVLVAGEGGRVERRPVETTGFREGSDQVLESGLTAEDQLIVSHLQKVRAGAVVVPKAKGETPAVAPAAEPAKAP
ncbi:MAG: efflux RND transporter periplasmic adaptor subunit [Verrucomicrobiae bacterium]|nr:efflux RND transporter periplasmic adaptor subunit [Verrucomicrobiae bacterium]